MAPPAPRRRDPLSLASKLLYALPAVPLDAVHTFHHTWVTKFYCDDVRMPALHFAVLHASERAWGIVIYPFLGLLVDRTIVAGRAARRCPGCAGRRRV